MKVYIETYGCQMNLSDTELVGGILAQNGIQIVGSAADADGILLNTCTVRENAEEKIFHRLQQLGHLKRGRPDLVVGVLGCLAQSLRKDLLDHSPVVDFLVGPDNYRTLPALFESRGGNGRRLEIRLSRSETYTDVPPLRRSGVNGWVTVMRGCDNFCTFCVVPYTRGRERSRDPEAILAEVRALVKGGFPQVTLLGQNVNSYRFGDWDFSRLMRGVSRVEGIGRVRFISPHPKGFPDELLSVLNEERAACPHIHLPLQAGSDRVLEQMNRGYTYEGYLKIVKRIREVLPDAAITTDLIAGFPGETEEEFRLTLRAIEEVRFESSFTFAYSERRNTVASRRFRDDIPHEVKRERVARMVELQRAVSTERHRERIGNEAEVLVEGGSKKSNLEAFGRTPQGTGVVFPARQIRPGKFVRVRVTDATTNTLIGVLAS